MRTWWIGGLALLCACTHASELDELRERLAAARDGGTDADTDADAGDDARIEGGTDADVGTEDGGPERPACEVVAPAAGSLLAIDDREPEEPGLQIEVEIETDAAGRDAPLFLVVDGDGKAAAMASAERVAQGRFVARVTLSLDEGAHSVVAECSNADVTAVSEPVEWQVDTQGCTPSFTVPEKNARFTAFDDLDEEAPGVQLRVSGELGGSDCASVVAYTCGEEVPDPVGGASETFRRTATLVGQGNIELCVTAEDTSGNVETRRLGVEHVVCDASEVLCEADRACHDDTDDNPDFCGPDCRTCEAPSHGAALCDEGRCGVACDDGYVWSGSACVYRPSCKGLEATCGSDSCCAFDAVAESGDEPLRVQRGYDQSGKSTGVVGWVSEDEQLAVTVDDFELDRFEVTVGRFRTFLDAYEGWLGGASKINPRNGQGHHPAAPASGWQSAWNERYVADASVGTSVRLLPVDRADFESRLTVCGPSTWTAQPGDLEDVPINCVSFYEAFLFCLFEGGRLPTEAEWIVASAGGRQQRAYPWSSPPSDDSISDEHAVYGGTESQGPEPAGSKRAGSGRWGTQDLAGNLYEWTRDTWVGAGATYASGSSNPVDLGGDTNLGAERVTHGGSYKFPADYLRTVYRQPLSSTGRINDVGFRCAYPAQNDN